jgi:hypothetical protein
MITHIEMSIVLGMSALVLERYKLARAKPETKLEISLRPRSGVWLAADAILSTK